MAFTGFPKDALRFYEELALDNTRTWWLANKRRYEEHVRGPFELLLDELFDEFGEAKVFRPNKDTRFSKDKSPYKTNIGGVAGGHYVSLSAEGLFYGGGRYELQREELARFRRALDEPTHVRALERIAADLEAEGLTVQGSELKTAPRGFSADHPQIRWLRHRRLYAGREDPPAAWLHTPEALDRVREVWRAVDPLCRWLDDVVVG